MLKLRVCENHFSLLKHQMRLVSGFVRVQGTTEGWWKLQMFFLTLVDDWLMIDTLRSSKAERLPNCGQLSYQLTYLIHFDVAPLRLSTSFSISENFLCENVSNEDSVLAKWEMIMRKTQINESVDQVRRKKNVFPSWSLSFLLSFVKNWRKKMKSRKCSLCKNFLYGENFLLALVQPTTLLIPFYLHQIGSKISTETYFPSTLLKYINTMCTRSSIREISLLIYRTLPEMADDDTRRYSK